MSKGNIVKYALVNALGTSLYVIAITYLIYLGGKGLFEDSETVFIPAAMLMLFVFSAAFTGSLIFGRPVMWYLDGKKREALSLLAITLGIFLVVAITILLVLIALT
jgi:hypothetical protein